MGLNTGTRGNRTFVNIVNGRFAKRVTEDTPGAVKRIIEKKDKSKKEVWEIYYDDVNGMIDSVEIDETGDFGDQAKVNMSDVGEKFTVTLSMASREAKSFLCCLKNIDLRSEVILMPFNFESKEERGKKVIGMNTYQGGKKKEFKVAPYFSKENPNGLPPVPEGSDTDEFKIVMKQQEIFLKKWAKKFIVENFDARPEAPTREVKPAETEAFTPTDDLPF